MKTLSRRHFLNGSLLGVVLASLSLAAPMGCGSSYVPYPLPDEGIRRTLASAGHSKYSGLDGLVSQFTFYLVKGEEDQGVAFQVLSLGSLKGYNVVLTLGALTGDPHDPKWIGAPTDAGYTQANDVIVDLKSVAGRRIVASDLKGSLAGKSLDKFIGAIGHIWLEVRDPKTGTIVWDSSLKVHEGGGGGLSDPGGYDAGGNDELGSGPPPTPAPTPTPEPGP